ncbi:MAG TPA: methyltransferase domain-containing protein [Chitinophagaceae bacterium]|nr:methyltransferase domain-containing protein [Chitinophagaceae bacterium]
MNLSNRSYQKELLDGSDIPFADIRQNMRELNVINTYLGGHAITISGCKSLLKNKQQVSVCEIGCGGGDNLLAIYQWCQRKGISATLTGIDYNKECIAVAAEQLPPEATLICSDYKAVNFEGQLPDIIFSSLFCHHFTDPELVFMLQWMQQHSKTGFFINDLHRHFLAYYSIKMLTGLFSKSYLVRHDAPLSVQRGFTKTDWQRLLQAAALPHYRIQWKWAFRWLITSRHQ